MNAPAISVILPSYNRSATLPRAIASVLAQTYPDFELIVVDDGSEEDLQPVIAQFDDPRLRYLRRDRNGGVAAARNSGIEAARGAWIAFQDSDDEWLLDKLALQRDALGSKDDEAEMVVSGLLRAGGRVRWYPLEPQRSRGVATLDDVLERPIAYTQSWLVRREHVVEAGGFDEKLRIWDDWDLLLRLAALRLRIHLVATPTVISEQESDSISRDKSRFIHDMQWMLEKHAALLAGHPDKAANLQYVLARLLASDGRLREARRVLLAIVRQHPGRLRPWLLLAASMLGRHFVRRRLRMAAAEGAT